MKKWIRWQGLVPFVCIVAGLAVFWYLFLDVIVERSMESFGTKVVGAKVDIDRVDVSLFPAGLLIVRLQVTNPDAPMTNAVEIERMDLALNTPGLLRKKIIVEEVAMDGVRLNTPRSASGAVKRARKKEAPKDSEKIKLLLKKAGCAEMELPALKTPDVKKILAEENLASLELIQNFQVKLESGKKNLEETLKTLPNEKTFADYRKRIEKLQGKKGSVGALLSTATDAVQLKKDIQTDVDRLNKEVKSFKTGIEDFKTEFSQLTKASGEDIKKLRSKYTLSPQGISNMSQMLLGSRFCDYWEKGYAWYQRIKPYLKRPQKSAAEPETAAPVRGKGIHVRFPEKTPLPDFLVRQARANIVLDRGDLTGVIENVTDNQPLVGKPLSFKFLGRAMKGMQSFNAIGEVNHVRPDMPKYKVETTIAALELKNVKLSNAEAFPVTLREGVTDLDFNFTLAGEDLSMRLNLGFKRVKMAAGAGENAGGLVGAMATAIAGVDRFQVTSQAKGTVEGYTFDIRSDLDNILKSAIGNLVNAEIAKFTANLEKEIMARVEGPLADAKGRIEAFGPIGTELSQRLDVGNNLLKSDVLKGIKLPI